MAPPVSEGLALSLALCRKEIDHVDHGKFQESSKHAQINQKAKCLCRYPKNLVGNHAKVRRLTILSTLLKTKIDPQKRWC